MPLELMPCSGLTLFEGLFMGESGSPSDESGMPAPSASLLLAVLAARARLAPLERFDPQLAEVRSIRLRRSMNLFDNLPDKFCGGAVPLQFGA